MKKCRFTAIFFVFLFLSWAAAQAIYPSAKLKVVNAKIKSHSKESLNTLWFNYIYEYPEVLTATGKKYKVDQYCSYSADLDAQGKVLMDSIKLLNHKQNFKYNLKAIQFLRENELIFVKKDSTKPIELEFVYKSF